MNSLTGDIISITKTWHFSHFDNGFEKSSDSGKLPYWNGVLSAYQTFGMNFHGT